MVSSHDTSIMKIEVSDFSCPSEYGISHCVESKGLPLDKWSKYLGRSTIFSRRRTPGNQVLQVGTWQFQSTYAAFSLRYVSCKAMDTFCVGPGVVAQNAV